MSCQNNANRTAGAALKCGLSGLGNKMAYVAGVGAGAAAGGAAGSLLMPGLGTAGGILLGGSLGYRGVRAIQAARGRKAEEKAWQSSRTGQKAIARRDRDLQKTRQAYRQKASRLKSRKEKVEAEYQAAREIGLEQVGGLKAARNVKQAAVSPEVQAAAGAALEGAVNIAGQLLAEDRQTNVPGQRGGRSPGRDVGARAGREALKQAGQYRDRVRVQREHAWQRSPAGREATARYKAALRQWKTARDRVGRAYNLEQKAIRGKYDLSRAAFLRKREGDG